ncbi:hypothetical protein [Methyloraptor flagellatus]|uniref:Uncharacterized protein n=1 Tax=Methyloraptor flagellatus TaxID=3162530 RepID=A0AAU7XA48_9HYPH
MPIATAGAGSEGASVPEAARPVSGEAPSLGGSSVGSPSIELGRRLLAENGCNGACHLARVTDGNPMSLYTRSTRRVNAREELRRQVEVCVSRLNVMVFPEDIESVVGALDDDFYHFD